MRRRVLVLAVTALLAAGCGANTGVGPPPTNLDAAAPRPVPQLPETTTVCLPPDGSGLRAFISRSYGGYRNVSVTPVPTRDPRNPWSCP